MQRLKSLELLVFGTHQESCLFMLLLSGAHIVRGGMV